MVYLCHKHETQTQTSITRYAEILALALAETSKKDFN
jgi:hypothetical protein